MRQKKKTSLKLLDSLLEEPREPMGIVTSEQAMVELAIPMASVDDLLELKMTTRKKRRRRRPRKKRRTRNRVRGAIQSRTVKQQAVQHSVVVQQMVRPAEQLLDEADEPEGPLLSMTKLEMARMKKTNPTRRLYRPPNDTLLP